jgi:hypothetical protein
MRILSAMISVAMILETTGSLRILTRWSVPVQFSSWALCGISGYVRSVLASRAVNNKLGICYTVLINGINRRWRAQYNPVQSAGSDVNLLIIQVSNPFVWGGQCRSWAAPLTLRTHELIMLGSGDTAPHILNLYTRWKWMLSNRQWPLHLWGKHPRHVENVWAT